MDTKTDIVVIGGSAGSLPLVTRIIASLGPAYPVPVIIIMHRMRNVISDLGKLLNTPTSGPRIVEPDDKTLIEPGKVYLSPQNYHLLVEDGHICLDYSESVMFARPSIDVSFESVAHAYGNKAAGILLSGANNDGAAGLKAISDAGGTSIVQDPSTAEYPIMPRSAMNLNNHIFVYHPDEIIAFLRSLQS